MRIAFFGDSLTAGVPGCSYFAVLREQFPNHTLLNFGRPNDTVIGLFHRLSSIQTDQPFDLAYLWIGVNDVSKKESWSSRTFNALRGQRRTSDTDEFCTYYRKILGLLSTIVKHLIVAPPALKGEVLDNYWNSRITILAELIQGMTEKYERAEFLDLRSTFIRALKEKPSSDYLLQNHMRVILDALLLRSDGQIDRKASQRGLHLTLDGVHLNSLGAKLVAGEFSRTIQNMTSFAK